MTATKTGVFTISLDFELFWGVRDKITLAEYEENLRGTPGAVKKILTLFSENGIHATWATVGFLFFKGQNELRENLPSILPTYSNPALCPYRYEKSASLDRELHFAPDLIAAIRATPGQEIASHTHSHYYCLENGQEAAQFRADLELAVEVASAQKIEIKSLVFPRNQWNSEYLSILNAIGITSFRGNEKHWIYQASEDSQQNVLRRAIRLIDAYLNLSGNHTYTLSQLGKARPYNIAASRFLRPYSSYLKMLDGLKLRRITRAMTAAAINREVFHLWWHPHNFGLHTNENVEFLQKILIHFAFLRKTFGMRSLNMAEVTEVASKAMGEQ